MVFQCIDVNSKNHLRILRQIFSIYGIAPNYEWLGMEGKCHKPTYKYRAWLNDKVAFGDGKTKREAMHNAAKAIIGQLTENCKTDDSTAILSSFNDSIFYNAMGWLQHLCTARRWPLPKYDTIELEQPHVLPFRKSCVVSQYCGIGQGKTKEIARQLAAHKVMMIIQKGIYPNSKANQYLWIHRFYEDGFFDFGFFDDRFFDGLFGDGFYDDGFIDDGFFDDGFFDISHVCRNRDIKSIIQHLQKVAVDNQIEVKYKHIEERTIAGQFQCLVRLSTHPIGSCHGTGACTTMALANAAIYAVRYLRKLAIF